MTVKNKGDDSLDVLMETKHDEFVQKDEINVHLPHIDSCFLGLSKI